MTWFESLTGYREDSPDTVRSELYVEGSRLRSRRNGRSWICGEFEMPSLARLRDRARGLKREPRAISVREVVADV